MSTEKKKVIVKKVKQKVSKPSVKKVVAKKTPKSFRTKVELVSKSIDEKKDTLKQPEKRSVVTGVILPTNMSKRSIEKSIVLKNDLNQYFERSIYLVSYVAAFCFILVGATVATSSLLSSNNLHLKAETLNSSDAVFEESSDTYDSSEFNFISDIPDNIIDSIPIYFTVTNVKNVVSKIKNINQTGFFDLDMEKLQDDEYKSRIPADKLSHGYYQFIIYISPKNGDSAYAKSSDKFFVGSEEDEKMFNHPKDEDLESTTENDDISDSDSEIIEDSVTDPDGDVMIEEGSVVIFDSDDDSFSSSESAPDTDSDKKTISTTDSGESDEVDISSVDDYHNIKLILNDDVMSGVTSVKVYPNLDYVYLELYARRLNSLSSRFVGLAAKYLDEWKFVIDTKNLPNGEYVFFVKAEIKNSVKVIKSKPYPISIKNQSVYIEDDQESKPPEIVVIPIKYPEEREVLEIEDVYYSDDESFSEFAKKKADSILIINSTQINELLKRYSVARQTQDETLMAVSLGQIDKKREELSLHTLSVNDTKYLSEDIDAFLKKRITDSVNKIDLFEQVRKEKTSNVSIDADGDGISDFDEIKLYGTDPKLADSDNDGVSDGVEVMKGFNPNDATSEAIIVFQSPKESVGLIRSDALVINEVLAVTQSISDGQGIETGGTVVVKAEIRGRALPNSFVTLFIFSDPITVTIKTDSDGSFVYTYEKELDDGQHEVYVVVTDNTGEIIAQSSPFTFIKTAQAFTPVGATEDSVVTPESVIESSQQGYNVAVGIGILAFGIILLMLGIGLKPKDEVIKGE